MMATDKTKAEEAHEKELADAKAKKDAAAASRGYDPNVTAARDLNAPTTFSIPPEDMMTEQEKLAAAGGAGDETAGVGPVSPAEHTTGPVETIEDQGIGPRTPYPEGNPPPAVREETTRSQAVKKEPR